MVLEKLIALERIWSAVELISECVSLSDWTTFPQSELNTSAGRNNIVK